MIKTWDELRTAPPPPVSANAKDLICVCEDQNIIPLSVNPFPDIQDIQMQFKEAGKESEQYAVVTAARESRTENLDKFWSITCLVIFATCSLITALFVLQSKFALDFLPKIHSGETAALMLGLGSVLSAKALALKQKLFQKRTFVKRPPPIRDWQLMVVFDEIARFPWFAKVPLATIQEQINNDNMSADCRYTQEMSNGPYISAGVLGTIGLFCGMLPSIMFPWPFMWKALFTLGIGLSGAGVGYFWAWKFFAKESIWVVRRMIQRMPDGKFNYESLPNIEPIKHTQLSGMIAANAPEYRQAVAMAALEASHNSGNSKEPISVMEKLHLAVAFGPRVLRATSLYEIVFSEDVRRIMRDKPQKGINKEQIIRAGLALGSIGIMLAAFYFLGS